MANVIDLGSVHGQAMGAIAQGVGQVLMEHAPYSAEGQPLASTFADYLVPLATDLPEMRVENTQTWNPNVPHGAKGAGEGGSIGLPPAIAAAVLDAIGVNERCFSRPPTPRRLLKLIREVRPKKSMAAASQRL